MWTLGNGPHQRHSEDIWTDSLWREAVKWGRDGVLVNTLNTLLTSAFDLVLHFYKRGGIQKRQKELERQLSSVEFTKAQQAPEVQSSCIETHTIKDIRLQNVLDLLHQHSIIPRKKQYLANLACTIKQTTGRGCNQNWTEYPDHSQKSHNASHWHCYQWLRRSGQEVQTEPCCSLSKTWQVEATLPW